MEYLLWVLGAFFTIIILGLLMMFIRNWFNSIKEQLRDAISLLTESVNRLRDEIGKLFERSDTDRKAQSDCMLNAQRTYATKSELRDVDMRLREVEKARLN